LTPKSATALCFLVPVICIVADYEKKYSMIQSSLILPISGRTEQNYIPLSFKRDAVKAVVQISVP